MGVICNPAIVIKIALCQLVNFYLSQLKSNFSGILLGFTHPPTRSGSSTINIFYFIFISKHLFPSCWFNLNTCFVQKGWKQIFTMSVIYRKYFLQKSIPSSHFKIDIKIILIIYSSTFYYECFIKFLTYSTVEQSTIYPPLRSYN